MGDLIPATPTVPAVMIRPRIPLLRLPRAGATASGAVFNDAMQQLEQSDAGNAKQGSAPAFPGIILTAADGSSWQVTVATNGQLQTVQVQRA